MQAKALKEGLRGTECGGTGPLAVRELAHKALVDERGNGAVGAHAAHRAHAIARGRLRVGDDSERLERGGRKLTGVPRLHEGADHLVVAGVRVKPPAAGHVAQLKAAAQLGILGGKVLERRLGLVTATAEHLCKDGGLHGLGGHKQQRLEHRAHVVGL